MADNMKQFLKTSPIAKKVKPPVHLIIHRTSLSPKDIIRIKNLGQYGPIPKDEEICELEIGGQVLAYGKIIKKGNHYFFKVTNLTENEEVFYEN